MCGRWNSAILFLLVLFHMNLYGDAQLIGEERKYVFLEQALLERVRSTLLEITKAHEERMGRLEEDNKRIISELNSMKNLNPVHPSTEMTKALEERIGRLEEDNNRITSELNSVKDPINTSTEMTKALAERVGRLEEELNAVKDMNPITPSTEPLIGCPTSDNCGVVDLECPRFVMDPATLYLWFLSRDKLTLSNRRLDSTYDWPTVKDRKYRGAQGSSVITNRQTMYFETDIYYRIDQNLSSTNLVFEVGIATEKAIAQTHHVGGQKGAWAIRAHNSGTQGVVLTFGKYLHSEILSDATSGTEKYLKLGFFINRVDGTIAVLDINMNRKIYTFTNVDGSQEVWPVFGVYNPGYLFVRIRLNTEKVPCGLF